MVSILTRAFARVQRAVAENRPMSSKFQSSLELSPECNQTITKDEHLGFSFNPHSSFRPSATSQIMQEVLKRMFQSSLELSPECNAYSKALGEWFAQVSILTRAFARVQHSSGQIDVDRAISFNPHSSFRPSATNKGLLPDFIIASFNPHSSFRPSATISGAKDCTLRVFQSSLELSPECNTR